MYLSRIQLKESIGQNSQLGLLLKDRSYGIHRLLHDLFSDGDRFLFREEISNEQVSTSRSAPMYYTFSRTEPDTDSVIFDVNTKRFDPDVKAGDKLMFRLRANPTISKSVEGKRHSIRHDIAMNTQREFLISECQSRGLEFELSKRGMITALRSHQDYHGAQGYQQLQNAMEIRMNNAAKDWLIKRGDKYGFTIEFNQLQATGYRWNALPEKSRNAGFSSIDYEGVLTVTNAAYFLDKLVQGIGPSKAFGCGLMMIKRVN